MSAARTAPARTVQTVTPEVGPGQRPPARGSVHRLGETRRAVKASGPDIPTDDARQGIQSVEIAMTVLLTLEQGGRPMSLTQLSTAAGMQPSKVHRYLVSLGRVGLVSQSPTSGLYDLGPSLRRLGAAALQRMDEVSIASDHLPQLRDRTGQSVNLAVWGDDGPVIVRWDYGTHALPITVRVGATLPLLTSSVGRVYLAYLPSALTLPVLHAQTSDPAGRDGLAVADIVAAVRRDGLASTAGGVIPGIYSVAAPVFTTGGQPPLAVSVALPERLADAALLQAVTAALLDTTRAISADLGSAPSTAATGEPTPNLPTTDGRRPSRRTRHAP